MARAGRWAVVVALALPIWLASGFASEGSDRLTARHVDASLLGSDRAAEVRSRRIDRAVTETLFADPPGRRRQNLYPTSTP